MTVDRDEVLRALERVIDPELRKPVTELDMVRSVEIEGADVAVTIALTVAGCPLRSSFQDQVAEHVGGLPGVQRVELRFDVMSPDEKAALTTKLRGGRPEKSISLDPATRVIAVASGKGGVGKSSLTVNLAAALDGLGQQVGVIDADVYGHSIPHMLGVHQRPIVVDKMIVPPVRGSLKLISIGNFLDENAPVMWRGPMLHRALEQFLSDVHWGELDTVVIDMPPGTGDMAISLGQLLPRAEVLVVTTPQPLAQDVAARAAMMAQKTGQKLLGVVENMSGDAFGEGGGARLADELDVPLLANDPARPGAARGRRRRRARGRSRSRRRVVARDRRLGRDRRGDAAGCNSQAADAAFLERKRAPGGALFPSLSRETGLALASLAALAVEVAQHPGAVDLAALDRDLVADLDVLDLVVVGDGARLRGRSVRRLDRDRGRADRLDHAADDEVDARLRRRARAAANRVGEDRGVGASAGADGAGSETARLRERPGQAAE